MGEGGGTSSGCEAGVWEWAGWREGLGAERDFVHLHVNGGWEALLELAGGVCSPG